MKKPSPINSRLAFTVALMLSASGVVPASSDAKISSTSTAPPKLALLVGISKYSGRQGLQPLEGSLNDVADIRAALIKDFGFDPKNIAVLTNEAATHEGVVKAIRTRLIQKAKSSPEGTFLFYYSGHGSQTRDVDGDEKRLDSRDVSDETLVTFDSTRDPKDNKHFDLVDDELDDLFDEVRASLKGKGSLTSILDCCYSGTATRGPALPSRSRSRVREVPPDTRPYPQSAPDNTRGASRISTTQTANYAAFSACMSTEKAEECDFDVPVNGQVKPRAHGVLTYFLLQTMKDATRTTTNSQVWSQLTRAISGPYQQNPQLEGEGNKLFLGGSKNQRPPAIPYTLTGRTLTFARGIESGAVTGGSVILSSSQELQITRADFGRSEITIRAGLKIPPRGTLRLATPFFGSNPLLMALATPLTLANPVAQQLNSYYSGTNTSYVRFAHGREKGAVTLVLGTRGEAFGLAGELLANASEASRGYYFSLGQGKSPLFNVFVPANSDGTVSEADVQRLRDCVENYAVQCKVGVLSNNSKGGEVVDQSVKFTTYHLTQSQVEQKMPPGMPLPLGTPISTDRRATVRVGDGVQFSFQNQTYKTLYVVALWLSQDGSVTLLETLDHRQFANLKSKGSDGDTATYGYQTQLPAGQENIKFFISLKPIDVFYLQRDPVTRAAAPSNPSPSPFDVIAGLATGTRGRIQSSAPLGFDTWATKSVGLSVIE